MMVIAGCGTGMVHELGTKSPLSVMTVACRSHLHTTRAAISSHESTGGSGEVTVAANTIMSCTAMFSIASPTTVERSEAIPGDRCSSPVALASR